jgi:archaellum component FlaC
MPASTAERLGIVETKVANLNEKVDDIKVDIKDMHDCLDRTRDDLSSTLQLMRQESSSQHDTLASKIEEMEKFKNKWMYMLLGGVAVLGWVSGHMDIITKIFK